jgi:hypothetical protein
VCLDTFWEHVVHCKKFPDFRYRHGFVRDFLFDIFRQAAVFVKKATHVNFLSYPLDGRSTLRPTYVMVYEWVEGKHVCVDLTRVSRLVGLRIRILW